MILGLVRLEDRIVFDGSDAGDQSNDRDAPPPTGPESTGNDRILAVDKSVDNADKLAAAAKDGVTVVLYDSRVDTLQDIRDMIAAACGEREYSSIGFAGHGSAGETILAVDAVLNLAELSANPDLAEFFTYISGLLGEGGRVDLFGCDIASGELGAELIATLEEVTGIDFAASDDPTGNETAGGDWLLETDGVDVADSYFDTDLLDDFLSILESDYFIDNGLITVDKSGPREVDVGTAFWDRDSIQLNETPPELKSVDLRFTLTKNDEPIDIRNYLAFGEKITYDGIKFKYTVGSVTYVLGYMEFFNNSFTFRMYTTDDPGTDPYRFPHLSFADVFGDADTPPSITFGALPDAEAGAVFALEIYATAYIETPLGETFAGAYFNSVDIAFANQPVIRPPEPVVPPPPVEPPPPSEEGNESTESPELEPEPEEPPYIPPAPPPTPGVSGGESPSGSDQNQSGSPSTETPSTETPSTETPSTETPSTETPSTEQPNTDGESEGDGDDTSGEETAAEDGESGEDGAAEETADEGDTGKDAAAESGAAEGDGDSGSQGTTAGADGEVRDGDANDAEMLRHRIQEEEEIVKFYPEDMREGVQEVVSIVAHSTGQDRTVLEAINISMAELGGTLTQFNSAFAQMLGMLSYLSDLSGDAEVIEWVQEIARARESLILSGSEQVAMLLEAVRDYKALPADRRDSVAFDSVVELNGSIDDVNRRLRSVIAGVSKMTREIGEMRESGVGSPIAAKLPEIKEHMKSVAEDMKAIHAKRDSMFFELRNAATIAGKAT